MWRSTLPIRAGDPVELTVAASLHRQTKQVVLLLDGTPTLPDTTFSGSGFYWSEGLQAHYVYLPAGRDSASFGISFDCDLSELTVCPLRLVGRARLGRSDVQGVLLSKTVPGEDAMTTAWLMEYTGAAT